MEKEDLERFSSFGGKMKVNKGMMRYYFGSGNALGKERLFGMHGPLLVGMPSPDSDSQELALEANVSDTRQTLISELVNNSGLSRSEAVKVVNEMVASGKLKEVEVEGLGKVLVWGK